MTDKHSEASGPGRVGYSDRLWSGVSPGFLSNMAPVSKEVKILIKPAFNKAAFQPCPGPFSAQKQPVLPADMTGKFRFPVWSRTPSRTALGTRFEWVGAWTTEAAREQCEQRVQSLRSISTQLHNNLRLCCVISFFFPDKIEA